MLTQEAGCGMYRVDNEEVFVELLLVVGKLFAVYVLLPHVEGFPHATVKLPYS